MRALVQRVSSASVSVDGDPVAKIGTGMLVLLAVGADDSPAAADWIASKLLRLRIFADDDRRDVSIEDVGGEILCVSQFTLYGETRRGSRPSYTAAAPEVAQPLYERVLQTLGAKGGRFGAHMEVALVNDGPVTLCIDSPLGL